MSKSNKIHRGYKYKEWREAVLREGNDRCSECGSTTGLTADHIKPVVNHPELIYAVSNGRILCDKCRVKDMLTSWENGLFKADYHPNIKRILSREL